MPRTLRSRIAAAAVLAAVVGGTLVAGSPASGDPLADKKAEATRIQQQVEALNAQAGAANEGYLAARTALDELQAKIVRNQADLATTQAGLDSARSKVRQYATGAYVNSDSKGGVFDLLDDGDLTAASARKGYADVAVGNETDVADGLKAAEQDHQAAQAALDAANGEAQRLAAQASAKQKAAQQAAGSAQQVLSKVKGDLAELIRQDEARKAAEAAAQAKAAADAAAAAAAAAARQRAATPAPQAAATPARTATTSGSTSTPRTAPAPTAPSVSVPSAGRAGVALSAAISQLGVPYAFAGATPGVSFDCSGLVMYAWGQAGVSLPHSARDQLRATTRVPLDQIQPGDIVYFGSNDYSGIEHDGIYVGGGTMVHAPHTGSVVGYASIYSMGMAIVAVSRPGV